MENPFEKGFSKPFPKLFGTPLLRNGLYFLVMLHVACHDHDMRQVIVLQHQFTAMPLCKLARQEVIG